MTTTDNITRIYPAAVEHTDQATPEDLAEQVFYAIEIVGANPTEHWDRLNAKLAQLRATFPQAPENQIPLFS